MKCCAFKASIPALKSIFKTPLDPKRRKYLATIAKKEYAVIDIKFGRKAMTTKIFAVLGNITEIKADAVVNAANTSLLGGGGVDGAIHRACGPDLLAACRPLGGCVTGRAKTTATFGRMFQNGVRFIIHAVGPVWQGGTANEAELLQDAYTASLSEAMLVGAKSVAFPAISCGVYSYPLDKATKIAYETVQGFIKQHPNAFDEIIFVAFSDVILNEYRKYIP